MSQEQKPLQTQELWATVRPMARLSEQVRLRFREEMTRKDMSQRDVAGVLGWSQSRVAHILTGRVEMSVDDLAEFAFGLGLQVTEVVRDHGLEFCAEMTPTELRLLEQIRALTNAQRDALMTIFHARPPEARRAGRPTTKKRPRLA